MSIPCTHINHYRVIRLLGENGRCDHIADFTNRNFTNEHDVNLAIKNRIVKEDDFKYHSYYTDKNHVKEKFLYWAARSPYHIDMNRVIEYIEKKYTTDPEYSDIMRSYILPSDAYKNADWNEYYARRYIIYIIRIAPNYLINTVGHIIDNLYNNDDNNGDDHDDDDGGLHWTTMWFHTSISFLKLLSEEMSEILDEIRMNKLRTILWHYKMFCVTHELREELCGRGKQNTPLFDRLRQFTNMTQDVIIFRLVNSPDTTNNNYKYSLWNYVRMFYRY
ncbi:hypothetical protein E23_00512 [Faustovirus]|nr:hypothetical protein D5a_00509 [Faustovirus]AMN85395.1 hypothetical protein E23_00512 [Faustovirus]